MAMGTQFPCLQMNRFHLKVQPQEAESGVFFHGCVFSLTTFRQKKGSCPYPNFPLYADSRWSVAERTEARRTALLPCHWPALGTGWNAADWHAAALHPTCLLSLPLPPPECHLSTTFPAAHNCCSVPSAVQHCCCSQRKLECCGKRAADWDIDPPAPSHCNSLHQPAPWTSSSALPATNDAAFKQALKTQTLLWHWNSIKVIKLAQKHRSCAGYCQAYWLIPHLNSIWETANINRFTKFTNVPAISFKLNHKMSFAHNWLIPKQNKPSPLIPNWRNCWLM